MTYLITGATGGLGGFALSSLRKLVPTSQIYALARSEQKAESLNQQGVQVRLGDYADPASLDAAFEGIDRILFVSGAPGNRQQEHQNVVNAATKAGVSFIAYTSFAQANKVNNMLSTDHQFTEKIIEESGIAHAFLRNNWYLENEVTLLKAALSSGTLDFAAGDATVGWALKREYAEAAARVLAGKQEYPTIIELSGKPVTYTQLAQALAEASGKPIEAQPLDDDAFVNALLGLQLPQEAAKGLLAVQRLIKAGDLQVESHDFEDVLGRPLTPLSDAVSEALAL